MGVAKNRGSEAHADDERLHGKGTSCTAMFRGVTYNADEVESKSWIHILEKGEYPGDITDGDGVVFDGYTVVDDAALDSVLARFQPGQPILVDYEHFSMDHDKSSEAAGWGMELRKTAEGTGLEMLVEWTAEAANKIKGKSYRYISPVVSGPIRDMEPYKKLFCRILRSAGLTNTPNMKVLRPVSANKQTNKNDMKHRQQLCALLGCAVSVTDDELDSAVNKHQSDFAEARNRASRIPTLEAELNALKQERDAAAIEKYKDVADAETVKDFMSANRERAIKHFDSLLSAKSSPPAKKHGDPMYSKNRAQSPDKSFDEEVPDEEAAAKFRAVEARATERSRKEGISFSTAFADEKAKAGL